MHAPTTTQMSSLLTVLVSMAGMMSLTGKEVNANQPNATSTIECHTRLYTYAIDHTYITDAGKRLDCYDTNITVLTCWGRCDTSEIADYKLPYRLSNHTVCAYDGIATRKHNLKYCHKDHPQPFVHVFDAVACKCSACGGDNTSCETLHG